MLWRHARILAVIAGLVFAAIVTTGAATAQQSAAPTTPAVSPPDAGDAALDAGLSGLGGVAGTLLTIWLWQRRRDDQLTSEMKRLERQLDARDAKHEARYEALNALITDLRIKIARFEPPETP